MRLKPINSKKVSSEVMEQIKDQIISGEWEPGCKIPGEMELSEKMCVSRVSVRDAIHQLVGMGVLTVRRGEGTFVNEVLPKDYFNLLLPVLMLDKVSLIEFIEFRQMMETESARVAARQHDEIIIGKLSEIISNMEKFQDDKEKFSEEDVQFHTMLALATKNSVVIKVNTIIHDLMKNAMEEIVNITGPEGGIYYHKKILEAIINHDEDSAAHFMRNHIETTLERIKSQDMVTLRYDVK